MFAPWVASALMNGVDALPMMLPSERFSSTTMTTCAGRGSAAAARPTPGAKGMAATAVSASAPANRSARYGRPVRLLG